MFIKVRKFIENSPSAREITFGYTTFWFAGTYLIGFKHLGKYYKIQPSTGYAGKCFDKLPNGTHNADWKAGMKQHIPVYTDYRMNQPAINTTFGKGSNGFSISFDNARIYFSNDILIGFDVYDIRYILDHGTNTVMRKHIATLNNPTIHTIIVDQQHLLEAFDRYFNQFERAISCL